MGFAIVSDIHANLPAFQAVLDDIEVQKKYHKIERIFCLGDIIGYGCQPVEVLALLSEHVRIGDIVIGNHEDLYWGRIDENFDPKGKLMIAYNKHLIEQNATAKKYLHEIEEKTSHSSLVYYKRSRLFLTHIGPNKDYLTYPYPWDDTVLLPNMIAQFQNELPQPKGLRKLFKSNFDFFLYGHTHFPTMAFRSDASEMKSVKISGKFAFSDIPGDKKELLINPGSVGYSRDGNPKASYMIVDEGAGILIPRRVAYKFDSNSYILAKRWLVENKNELGEIKNLGDNKIRELVDNVHANARNANFAVQLTRLPDDDWRRYYGY